MTIAGVRVCGWVRVRVSVSVSVVCVCVFAWRKREDRKKEKGEKTEKEREEKEKDGLLLVLNKLSYVHVAGSTVVNDVQGVRCCARVTACAADACMRFQSV